MRRDRVRACVRRASSGRGSRPAARRVSRRCGRPNPRQTPRRSVAPSLRTARGVAWRVAVASGQARNRRLPDGRPLAPHHRVPKWPLRSRSPARPRRFFLSRAPSRPREARAPRPRLAPRDDPGRHFAAWHARGPDRAGDAAPGGRRGAPSRSPPAVHPPIRRRPWRQQVHGGTGLRSPGRVGPHSIAPRRRLLRRQAGAAGRPERGWHATRPCDSRFGDRETRGRSVCTSSIGPVPAGFRPGGWRTAVWTGPCVGFRGSGFAASSGIARHRGGSPRCARS